MVKKAPPIKLYPRGVFVEKVNALLEGGPGEYINVLLEAANQTELDFFLENTDLDSLIEKSVSTEESALGKMRQIWFNWSSMTYQNSLITFPIQAPSFSNQVAPEWNPNPDDELGMTLKKYFDAIESEREIRQAVRAVGYKYLPTWPTVYFVDQIPDLRNELGYDPFGDLEKYAANVDQAIPHRPCDIEKITASILVKDQLFVANILIATQFATAWNEASQEIVKKFDAEESPYGTRGVANLGRLIILANLHALAQTVDHSFIRKYQKQILDCINIIELKEPVGVDNASENVEELNETMQLMGSLTQMFEEYESLGVSNNVAMKLGLAYINLLLMAMFCDAANHEEILDDLDILKQLPIVSPFMTSGLRESIAQLLIDESCEGDCNVGDEWHVIAFAHQKDLVSEHELVNGLCKIYDQLNFGRAAISKSTFIEMANEYLLAHGPDLDGDECAREFFVASQDLIGWFFSTSENYATPPFITSLESLRCFCDRKILSSHKKYDINPIWALSQILHDDDEDYSSEERLSSPSRFIAVADILLVNGMVAGASCVFNYAVVSEALRMIADVNYKNGDVPTYLAPFGDWITFHGVLSRLLLSSKKDSTEKAVAFAVDCFKQSTVRQFGLVIDELSAYLGGAIEVPESKRTAEVIKLVQTKGNSIRERLIHLVGEDTWNALPQKIRGQVIQCEQVYDQSMGDQVLSDEPNYAWLTWYNTLIERMFKLKLSPMWSDPALSRDIDTSYATAVRKAVVAPKFSLGSALYVCNGAVESGNRAVFDFLKHRGVDLHYIATNLSKELLKAIRIRNKSTHAEDISFEEASEARRIFLTKLPDIVRSLGITDQDY